MIHLLTKTIQKVRTWSSGGPLVPGALLALLCCIVPQAAQGQSGLSIKWSYTPISQAESVAYSPDGSLIAVGGESGIQIYASATQTLSRCIPAGYYVSDLKFSPDGQTLIGACENQIVIWSVANGNVLNTIPISSSYVTALAISQDGSKLAACETNAPSIFQLPISTVEAWSLPSGSHISFASLGAGYLAGISFSPDGNSVAVCGTGGPGLLQILNVATMEIVEGFNPNTSYVYSVVYSPDGSSIANTSSTWNDTSQSYSYQLQIWNVATQTQTETLASGIDPVALMFSPDGKLLLDGGENSQSAGAAEVWNLSTGTRVTTLTDSSIGSLASISLSPNGGSLAACGSAPTPPYSSVLGFLDVWNISSGALTTTNLAALYNSTTGMALSGDGKTLIVSGTQVDPTTFGTSDWLGLWDSSTGAPTGSLKPEGHVSTIAASPDGKLLADAGYLDGTNASGSFVEVWNLQQGRVIQSIPTTISTITGISISADGSILAIGGWANSSEGSTGVLELWNASTGQELASLPTSMNEGVASLAFSPTGSTLAASGKASSFLGYAYGVVEVWDTAAQTLITSLDTGIFNVLALAFSPDGQMLADGGQRYSPFGTGPVPGMELWDISHATLLSSFPAISTAGLVNSIAISSNGTSLFAATNVGLSAFNLGNYGLSASYPMFSVGSVSISPDSSDLYLLTQYGGLLAATNPFQVSVPVAAVSFSPTAVVGGQTTTGTVTLKQPAPPTGAGIQLTSNSPSAKVPDFVAAAPGLTTAFFTVTTTGVATRTSATITAGTGSLAATSTLTIEPPALEFLYGPSATQGGETFTGSVLLSGLAPAGGIVITLTSSDSSVTVPKSVTVPAGQDSAQFKCASAGVSAQKTVKVSGTFGGVVESFSVTLDPTSINTLGIEPDPVAGGTRCTGSFTLLGKAPAGGLLVTLASDSKAVSTPSSVIIGAGKASGAFVVRTSPVAAALTATITVTCNGYSYAMSLTVLPPVLTSITLKPGSVKGGENSVGTVKLGSPAPSGGTVVSLSTGISNVNLPASVTIPAGKTSVEFTIRTKKVSQSTSTTINATLGSSSASASLTVS